MPAASAPRGAPHGEPVSPVATGPQAPSPASGMPAPSPAPRPPPPQGTEHYSDIGSGSSYTGGSSGTHAYHSSVSTLDGSTDFAATSAGRPDAAGSANGTAAASPGRHSAADEAAARARADAAVRAASSARAAAEAAHRASRAAAAAAASGGQIQQHASNDDSSGLGLNDEDSGFGPLPDMDFADRVWRARRQEGQARILSRVEMSAMSSTSSQQSYGGRGSDRSGGVRWSGVAAQGGGGRRENGAGGAMRMGDTEEEKEISLLGGRGACDFCFHSDAYNQIPGAIPLKHTYRFSCCTNHNPDVQRLKERGRAGGWRGGK